MSTMSARMAPVTAPAVSWTAETDQMLVGRMQSGDSEALGNLYARYSIRAHRVAHAVCHDDGCAEEIVQEAFISIWRSRATYQAARGSVGAWTMKIVQNRAIDVVRREGAIENRRDDVTALRSRAAGEDVARDAERDDLTCILRAALAELPAAQAEVVELAFFGGLSHDEIAARLALPPGTVKGRARLGLKRLRRELVDI